MEIAFQTSKKFFRPFLNKLIFNSFSSFRLRAGFDAGVMERFLFPSSFQMLILTAPKRRKKKNVFFGKWIRHRLHFAYMAVALWISIAFRLEVVWTWTRFRNLLLFPFFCVIIRKNFTTRIGQEKEKKKKGSDNCTLKRRSRWEVYIGGCELHRGESNEIMDHRLSVSSSTPCIYQSIHLGQTRNL